MKRRSFEILIFSMVIIISITPLSLHYILNLFYNMRGEYVDYWPEIYMSISPTFVYNYCNYLNNYGNRGISRLRSLMFYIGFFNFIVSTSIFFSRLSLQRVYPEFDLICFYILTATALLNLIVTAIAAIDTQKKDIDNPREFFSENRYEMYLLERMDEKLNIIKNAKSEAVKENNTAEKSEDILNGSDILAEMLKNHIEIKEYFKISKIQSKFSFRFSIISSVCGIIVVIIATLGIVIFRKIEFSIIAAVSGAITEIISGIVLWIHNKSALQLNYYYDSLHENEKFLSAVNIADKLSEKKKEDMYIEIIRKQIDIQPKDKERGISDMDRK